MRKIVLVSLLLSAMCAAQKTAASLWGVVVDSRTGAVVSLAEVTATCKNVVKKETTNKNGQFWFESLPEDPGCKLDLRASGFQPLTVQPVPLMSGYTVPLHIALAFGAEAIPATPPVPIVNATGALPRDKPSAIIAAEMTTSAGGPFDFPGDVTGTVVGASGAVVAGARVSLERNGDVKSVVTNGEGQFWFPMSRAGTYRLLVAAKGYKTAQITGLAVEGVGYCKSLATRIQLRAGDEAAIDDFHPQTVKVDYCTFVRVPNLGSAFTPH
ncbi:MAG: carboxypeptidase-like regulatory domain-containing protein [Terriglobales bacterium]